MLKAFEIRGIWKMQIYRKLHARRPIQGLHVSALCDRRFLFVCVWFGTGAHLTLKDQHWAIAVESCLKSFGWSFCCHDNHDAHILKQMMMQVCPKEQIPIIIASSFKVTSRRQACKSVACTKLTKGQVLACSYVSICKNMNFFQQQREHHH